MVSSRRRMLPAASTRSTPGSAATSRTSCSATGSATAIGVRSPWRRCASSPLRDVLGGLGAEAAQRSDGVIGECAGEVVDGAHAQPLVEERSALGTDAGDVHDLRERGWNLGGDAIELVEGAVVDDLGDIRGHLRAYAGNLGEAVLGGQRRDLLRPGTNSARGLLVAEEAELVGAGELEECRHQVELGRDCHVVVGGHTFRVPECAERLLPHASSHAVSASRVSRALPSCSVTAEVAVPPSLVRRSTTPRMSTALAASEPKSSLAAENSSGVRSAGCGPLARAAARACPRSRAPG